MLKKTFAPQSTYFMSYGVSHASNWEITVMDNMNESVKNVLYLKVTFKYKVIQSGWEVMLNTIKVILNKEVSQKTTRPFHPK